MPKATAKPLVPATPPCDVCRPYAEALGVAVGIAEWLLENAKRQMVPDIFTIGVMEGRLRAAVAGVGRGTTGATNGRAGR